MGHFIRQQYSLSENTHCSIIKAGVNHTYLVKDGAAQYIFRVYSYGWRTREAVAEELRLLRHLQDQHIPVSYAIPCKDGTLIQELEAPEGGRLGVLFLYMQGEKLHNSSPQTHFNIGEVMAALHHHTEGFRLERTTYNVQTLLIEPFEQLKKFLPAETAEMRFMAAAQQYLVDALNNIKEQQLRKGAVHLDLWFDNLHVDKRNRINIFDFDFCGNGWLCLDVAYYLMQLQVIEPDKKEYHAKAAAFLQGYEGERAMSDEEKRLLPILGASLHFFYLGVQCARFDDWSNVFINETYLKRYIMARVKSFFDFHKMSPLAASAK